MNIVLLHNHFDQDHLNKVIEEMKVLGAPTIRCYDLGFDGIIQAVEGSHRLRACEELEIEPIIEMIDEDARIEDLGLDCGDNMAETVKELGDWENETMYF